MLKKTFQFVLDDVSNDAAVSDVVFDDKEFKKFWVCCFWQI